MKKINNRLERFLLSKGFSIPQQVTGAPGRLEPNEEYLELTPPKDWHSGRITYAVADYFSCQHLETAVDGGNITVSQGDTVVYRITVSAFNFPAVAIFVGSNTGAVYISIFHLHPVIRSYKNWVHRFFVQRFCHHDWEGVSQSIMSNPKKGFSRRSTSICWNCSLKRVQSKFT